MSKHELPYDLHGPALVVGRVPALPSSVAVDVLAGNDPIEAVRRRYAEDPYARTALAMSSPSLAQAVDEWIDGKVSRNSKTPLRALAYLLRMTTRPTPFGLLAGVGHVALGNETTLQIDDRSTVRRTFTRPDMGLMCELAERVETGPDRGKVRYSTNECALVRGDRLYVTNIALANSVVNGTERRTDQREVSLKHTTAVAFVRERCTRPRAYDSIAADLCERFGAETPDARRLLDRLIEAGVVISELRASPLGDPVAYLAERFESYAADVAPQLSAAREAAERFDATPLSERTPAQALTVAEAFASLAQRDASNAVQIDTRVFFEGTLASCVLEDAAVLAESYMRMGRVVSLEAFATRFMERYEGSERMVPLLELVDNNIGLGAPDKTSFAEQERAERDALLLQLACEAMRSNTEEIVLDGDLIDRFLPQLTEDEPIASSLEVGFFIDAARREDVDRGRYRMIGGFTSDAATRSVGRFAHALGDEFAARLRDIASASVSPDQLVAEFAYAPSLVRSYNVSIRPLLFDRQVRAGIGAEAPESAVSPADLWVGRERNRFFLWSASLHRRLTVRETHALTTFTSAPNLCRLLALLAIDGTRLPAMDWGAAQRLPCLPRVRRGRVVLAPRCWNVNRAEFGGSGEAAQRELERLRELWNLPRYVYLCETDHRLLLDLDSSIAGELLDDQAAQGVLRLEEALPSPARTWLPGIAGTHAIEFVAQAVAVPNARRAPLPDYAPLTLAGRSTYGPGSQWVYAKLYMGGQATDNFIAQSLAPLARRLRDDGLADLWFFIRYGDPAPHVRFRLHAADAESAGRLRDALLGEAESWLAHGRLARYALETYDPEYERYGGVELLREAERFFCYDSDACADVIAEGIVDTSARIEAAASTFDALVRGDAAIDALVLVAFSADARKKLAPRDREALRRIATAPLQAPSQVLVAALAGGRPEKRLADLVHMHCNRLGVHGTDEERVRQLLRALALSRAARRSPEAVTA